MQTTLPFQTTSQRPDQPADRLDADLDLLIAGLGGMGVVGLTQRIAELLRGRYRRLYTREGRGFAQRRASVVGSLRAGPRVHSAELVAGANLLLALEPVEALRHAHLLRSDAQVVLCDNCVWPAGFAGNDWQPLPADAVAARLRTTGATVLTLPVCDWLKAHQLPVLFAASAALGAFTALAGLPLALVAQRLGDGWPVADRQGNLLLARLAYEHVNARLDVTPALAVAA